MNLICSKNNLIDGINTVLKAVPSRTTLPILECIFISAENDSIKLLCNNLEMGIETSPIDATVIKPGCIAIDARKFSEIIRRLPDGNVSISTNENITTIKSARAEFKVSSQKGDDFPKLPDLEKTEAYTISAQEFKNMIKETVFSVSLDESKPILMGELLEIKKNKLNVVALDGFRISFRSTDIDSDNDVSIVVPSKTLSDITKIFSNSEAEEISFFVSDKQAMFELENCKVVTRLISGKFLNYENIFTDEYKTIVKINRQELLECVERISLISSDSKKNPIKFDIQEDRIIVTSNTDLDTSYEELPTSIDGEPLKIAFNPKYIADALKAIESEQVSIQFTTSLNPCIIKPLYEDKDCQESGLNAKYLILPLRLND